MNAKIWIIYCWCSAVNELKFAAGWLVGAGAIVLAWCAWPFLKIGQLLVLPLVKLYPTECIHGADITAELLDLYLRHASPRKRAQVKTPRRAQVGDSAERQIPR